ncbi:hypothetical protein DTA24_09985 [Klebsiella sp. P1CD1]|uniref:hypothetical protein n=1 Tax=Klebsiella sp. P1CD1 TaxID=2267618 RepID=UPI000F4E982E|nr:hypothetical protein [Klebsiella sp. P1CD1]AYW18954.1 hypothetical protein DTA24_09985 [Klebsiella sp. P1CD1]
MNQTHSIPEIYNPEIPYTIKCEIIRQLCQAMASHKGMTVQAFRAYLVDKIHVDFEHLDDNRVGMLLLYEYLYSLRPAACSAAKQKRLH